MKAPAVALMCHMYCELAESHVTHFFSHLAHSLKPIGFPNLVIKPTPEPQLKLAQAKSEPIKL